jgi:hypothetical protein
VETVGGDRRGVDESLRARRGGRRLEHRARALQVDAAGLLEPAHDDEREMDDDVRVGDQGVDGAAVQHVALPVLGLAQPERGGVERPARHPQHAADAARPVAGAQERAADVAGRPGDGDREGRLRRDSPALPA